LITTGIFISGDLSLIFSFCLSTIIYLAIIMKFYYNYSKFYIICAITVMY